MWRGSMKNWIRSTWAGVEEPGFWSTIQTSQAWKIAHYTLSFAVPNDVADVVIDTIASLESL